MLRIAHVLKDEKFTDGVFRTFQEDKRLVNIPVFFTKNKNYKFKKINSINNIKLISESKEFLVFLNSNEFDVIYFHSLPILYWEFVKYIPNNKTVIWWLYGYEAYESFFCKKPILEICLYKPLTYKYYKRDLKKLLIKTVLFCRDQLFKTVFTNTKKTVRDMLTRIDYFQPIFSTELIMMKSAHSYFHADEFYNNNSLYFDLPVINEKKSNGGILFGNSSSFTNNHLDVWNEISAFCKDNKVIIPLSYGDPRLREIVKSNIVSDNIIYLERFMPKEEYFSLLDTCSYMVIGVMRQQASENIYYCISRGMKLFFYRDSIPYAYFKDKGYIVFAIEDVDDNSFSTPLTNEEIEHNQKMMLKEKEYCDNLYEVVIRHLYEKYN